MTQLTQILDQFRELSVADQAHLLHELQLIVAPSGKQDSGASNKHRLLDLMGLGRDVWNGIDAQNYVRQERATWNG